MSSKESRRREAVHLELENQERLGNHALAQSYRTLSTFWEITDHLPDGTPLWSKVPAVPDQGGTQ